MSVALFIFYIGLSFGLSCGELEPPASRALRQCWRWPGEVSGEGDGFQHQRDEYSSLDPEGSSQFGPKLKDSLATQVCYNLEIFPDLMWNNQICGPAWDESKEHSGEKLLWHCLQQQCCRVPHWAGMQVQSSSRPGELGIRSTMKPCLGWSTSTLPRDSSSERGASRSQWAG